MEKAGGFSAHYYALERRAMRALHRYGIEGSVDYVHPKEAKAEGGLHAYETMSISVNRPEDIATMYAALTHRKLQGQNDVMVRGVSRGVEFYIGTPAALQGIQ
jgi:hypothetical protein